MRLAQSWLLRRIASMETGPRIAIASATGNERIVQGLRADGMAFSRPELADPLQAGPLSQATKRPRHPQAVPKKSIRHSIYSETAVEHDRIGSLDHLRRGATRRGLKHDVERRHNDR